MTTPCRLILTILAASVLLGGCSRRTPPPNYPTTGIVRLKGGSPFSGGIITFTSKSEPGRVVDAVIGDDGRFELGFVFDNEKVRGALAGTYQVMVSPRMNPKIGVEIYVLPKDIVIEPRDNELSIEVDPAMKK